jgi:uncharacterized protein YegP (UPF0339 family)
MRFEVYKKNNNKYFFKMVDDADEILLSTQEYNEKESALQSIESVKKNVPLPSGIVKQQTADGDYFFNVINATGKVVCRSTTFYSPMLRDKMA